MRSLCLSPEALAALGQGHLAAAPPGARRLLPIAPLGAEPTPPWSALSAPLGDLAAAAAAQGQSVRLAALTLTESGQARPLRSGSRLMRHGELQAYEVIEVQDRVFELDQWVAPPGGLAALGPLPVREDELLGAVNLTEGKPDEDQLHDESFERSFRWLCLVFWAEADELELLAAAGLGTSLPALRGRIEAGGLEVEAEGLAMHILAQAGPAPSRSERAALLRAFCGLWSLDPLLTLLRRPQPAFEGEELPALIEALVTLPLADGSEVAAEIVARQAAMALIPTLELLQRLGQTPGAPDREPSLIALEAAFVSVPAPAGRAGAEDRVNALLALWPTLPPTWGDRLFLAFPMAPTGFPIDPVMLPLALRLREAKLSLPEVIRRVLIEVVHTRYAAHTPSVNAPALRCTCADCTELRAFLLDPSQRIWSLKSTKVRRTHVEAMVRRAGLALTVTTDTRTQPHVLLCTKRQVSEAQREQERSALRLLSVPVP